MNSSNILSSIDIGRYPCWKYDWCISGRCYYSFNAFVTNTSLYVSSYPYGIEKLSLNGSNLELIDVLRGHKFFAIAFFFVDNDDQLYLSLPNEDEVVRYRLNSVKYESVAGNGLRGSDDKRLDQPLGIFVNNKGAIYIADSNNHRIMKWGEDASSGVRVAGNGTRGSDITQLNEPTYVIVDANEYIYVSEAGNHRITRWAPNSTFGVCIAACTGSNGTGPTHLNQPHGLAFDSNGSLYVSDWGNHRVQKFPILPYSGKKEPI